MSSTFTFDLNCRRRPRYTSCRRGKRLRSTRLPPMLSKGRPLPNLPVLSSDLCWLVERQSGNSKTQMMDTVKSRRCRHSIFTAVGQRRQNTSAFSNFSCLLLLLYTLPEFCRSSLQCCHPIVSSVFLCFL